MLQRANLILLSLLLALLPWHGFLTTITPDYIRFWKEIVLLFLGVLNLKNLRKAKYKIPKRYWCSPYFYLISFLLYGGILIFTASDQNTSLIAFRYIATGYIAFLVFELSKPPRPKSHILYSVFLGSCTLSVLFGVWAQYLGGYEVLTAFYSHTISSWVPGQTLPLYHTIGDTIRMQGGASGPVAFSHMMVAALFVSLFSLEKKLKYHDRYLMAAPLLLIGIYLSYSRAAFLAALILLGLKALEHAKFHRNEKTIFSLAVMILLGIMLFFTPPIQSRLEHLMERAGTSDHFQRPMQAIIDGLESPFFGKLGSYGPAARIDNLKTFNNDQAPIAENVLADYFVQIGLIGLFLILGFWFTLWKTMPSNGKRWMLIILVTSLFATIFDMVPLSLIYFWILSQEYYHALDT
ncbi:MAG TPA: O-antigen ligase family protein [Candidatus Gracilibacteria bacterium]